MPSDTDRQTVATTLTPEDYERVAKVAARQGLSVSAYLRRALADEMRYDEIASCGGQVTINLPDGRVERVRYGR